MTGPGSAPVSEAASKLPLRLGEDVIDTVLNLLFRCPHKRVTRPITPVTKDGERDRGTYVVCLECGKQFTYDLSEMRIGIIYHRCLAHRRTQSEQEAPLCGTRVSRANRVDRKQSHEAAQESSGAARIAKGVTALHRKTLAAVTSSFHGLAAYG